MLKASSCTSHYFFCVMTLCVLVDRNQLLVEEIAAPWTPTKVNTAKCFTVILVTTYQITRCHIPEDQRR